MLKFKIYYRTLGGHTHLRVFVGLAGKTAMGKAGELTMTNEEFAVFQAQSCSFLFINETEG